MSRYRAPYRSHGTSSLFIKVSVLSPPIRGRGDERIRTVMTRKMESRTSRLVALNRHDSLIMSFLNKICIIHMFPSHINYGVLILEIMRCKYSSRNYMVYIN